MGAHLQFHLGPYVECKFRPAKKEITVHGCTTPTCEDYKLRWMGKSEGFCARCGSKKGPSKMTVDDRPEYMEVIRGERLTRVDTKGDETLFLIANVTLPGEPKCMTLKAGEPCHVDLSGSTWSINSDIDWFEKAFEKEIALLKTAYADVQVRWGLHQWYH